MKLTRNIEVKVQKLMRIFPVVALIGARQTGKTTISKKIAASWDYFDLENPNHFDLIHRDPVLFFKQFHSNLILDEAQKYPEIFNVLRGVIDEDRDQKGRFIVTGSSSPELLTNLSESLAGRVGILEVDTLKCNEFYKTNLSSFYDIFQEPLSKSNLKLEKPLCTLEQVRYFWLKGGYPEPLLLNDEVGFDLWMTNYITTYVNRDIASLFPRLDKIKFNRFINVLAKLSGTILNKSEIGRMLEFDEGTAREYISIAEKTFLWRELLSYENSISKSIVKMPKGHLRDSGLLHYMLNIKNEKILFQHPQMGPSFEGFVIEEILKGLNSTLVSNWKPYYFRTRGGSEIDLILEGPFGVLPIEIKYGTTVSSKQLRSLKQFISDNQLPFGIVINQSNTLIWLTEDILQLPVHYI